MLQRPRIYYMSHAWVARASMQYRPGAPILCQTGDLRGDPRHYWCRSVFRGAIMSVNSLWSGVGGGSVTNDVVRVLIVEDDPACTDLYTWYLRGDTEQRYDATVVDTGAAALEISQCSPPDCVILDFHLPDTTGLDILNEFGGGTGTVPFAVVMVSAMASSELATAALSAGALDCLDKTRVTETGLRRAVRTAIEKHRLQVQLEARQLEVAEQARRTRQILERVTDGFFALDRGWRFTYANPVAEKTFAQPDRTLLGERFPDLFGAPGGSSPLQRLAQALESGQPCAFETRYDERGVWLELHVYPDAEGLSVYFHDVTARKSAEAERERQFVRGQTLLRVVRDFAAEGDPRRLVASIAEEAVRLLGGQDVLVARWDEELQGLAPFAAADGEAPAGSRRGPGWRSMRSAVEQRRSVTVTSESARRSTSSQPDGRARAAVAAPMMDDGRLIGAIAVTTADDERRFSREDAELLEILAGLAAATIVGHEEARLEGVLLSARTAQHEVNNRLSLVRGYAELVAEHPDLPDDLRQMASEIVRGSRDASDILRRLGKLNAVREVEWGPGLRPTIDLRDRPS
jgi:PAS domain S-box-containing protein